MAGRGLVPQVLVCLSLFLFASKRSHEERISMYMDVPGRVCPSLGPVGRIVSGGGCLRSI